MSDALFSRLQATSRLPSPPAVAMRILQLMGDEEATLDELSLVISADPALTVKIMRYLRSPLLGLGFEGTTLNEVIGRIGTRGTQMLALSFSLMSLKQQQACPSFSGPRFWAESLARAVAARNLARATSHWRADEAFISGLVFRFGQLVLATAIPEEYEPVLQEIPNQKRSLARRESDAFGCDHVTLGRQLLEHWKLPEPIWGVFELDLPDESAPPHLLRLADAIGQFMARGEQHDGQNYEALVEAIDLHQGGGHDSARAFLEQAVTDWQSHATILSISTERAPDFEALAAEADEYRTALRLATEIELRDLREKNKQLAFLASRDRLTGMLNRDAFDQAMAKALDRATRKNGKIALLMIEVDAFDGIAREHGHPAADAVLRQVARFLKALSKPPAEAFRYSGTEFAVLVPGSSYEHALHIAETLRDAVENNPPIQAGRSVRFTASIGVSSAHWPENHQTADSLVAAAGARLYEASEAGGNVVK